MLLEQERTIQPNHLHLHHRHHYQAELTGQVTTTPSVAESKTKSETTDRTRPSQGVIDLTKPTINYAPAQGSTITDNTTLTITSTDDNINGSSTATITWTSSDGSATWNTTVNYNGTWTGTLNGLNANLTDGTITATINAQDWAGNQRTDTINSWTLNTTTATSIFALNYSTGMVKVENYLSPTVRFTVTPPAGGSFTTTTQHSTLGQIGSHQSPETTQKSWGWPGSSSTLTSGQIWVNITTTDAFNRTTVDTYTYLIDGEVTSTPTLSIIGSNTILANQSIPWTKLTTETGPIWLMQESETCVKCNATRTDNPSQPSTISITDITPSGAPGQSDNYTISCRIKDQVGNIGDNTNFSGVVVDLTKPTINYAPTQGNTITDNTTLTITSTDDKINGVIYGHHPHGRAAMEVRHGTPRSTTTGRGLGRSTGLNANLTDGTITATINAQETGLEPAHRHHQQLDTQHHNSDIHLRTQLQHRHGQGRKLPLTNRSIHRQHHQLEARSQQPHKHSTLGQIGSHQSPATTQKSWGWPGFSNHLTSGQIWVNITTTDAHNRTTVDTYTYLIDGEVTSTPTLSIIGSNTILANQTLLGPNSRLRLGNLVDAGGVGFSEVQCYKNGQSSPTIYTSITDITPSGAPGQSDNYTISCRIKDQVGNYGPYTNFSRVVDLTKPTINYAPTQGATITDNTTLTITSTDDKIAYGSSTATTSHGRAAMEVRHGTPRSTTTGRGLGRSTG